MENIELVIKIPDEEFKKISNSNPSYADDFSIYYAIKNGTPLPKGHGRLIDANATLKRHCTEFCAEKPSCYEDCLIYDLLHLAPTIIEADEGE